MGPADFALERFESTVATPRHALLRLRGRWSADEPLTLGAPQLEVEVDGQAQRYAPLDPREAAIAAGPEPEPWRCAYAIPAALLDDAGARFALVGTDGSLELPAPIELEPGDPAGDEALRLRERRERPDRRRGADRRTHPGSPAEGTEHRVDSRRTQADRRRRRSRAELDAFASQVRELEEQAGTLEAERADLLAGHEELEDDLERASAAREAADLAAAQQVAGVESDLEEARAALAEAEQRAERLEARAAETRQGVETLEEAVASAAERAVSLERDAHAAQAQVEELDSEALARAERLEADRDDLARRLEETSEEARAAHEELGRMTERARELEERAREAEQRSTALADRAVRDDQRLTELEAHRNRELAEAAAGREEAEAARADAETALASAQERTKELERQIAELEARGSELEARVAEAASDSAARADEAGRAAEAEAARLREQLSEVRVQARRELREAKRKLEGRPVSAQGGNGHDLADPEVADMVAQLEDQAHFVEQAGASLWATESELAEVRASQSVLMAEREEAVRRAREASERAARLAAQLRELEGEAPS